MRDNPNPIFLAHDCIPSKMKVEMLRVRKNVNVEISAILVGLQHGIKRKRKNLIQCFEHAECIMIDICDMLGND